MKKEIADKWVAKLRDPNSEQCFGTLLKVHYVEAIGDVDSYEIIYSDKMCAMGALAIIAIEEGIVDREEVLQLCTIPEEVMQWAGMKTNTGTYEVGRRPPHAASLHNNIIALNDQYEFTLASIADIVESVWEEL